MNTNWVTYCWRFLDRYLAFALLQIYNSGNIHNKKKIDIGSPLGRCLSRFLLIQIFFPMLSVLSSTLPCIFQAVSEHSIQYKLSLYIPKSNINVCHSIIYIPFYQMDRLYLWSKIVCFLSHSIIRLAYKLKLKVAVNLTDYLFFLMTLKHLLYCKYFCFNTRSQINPFAIQLHLWNILNIYLAVFFCSFCLPSFILQLWNRVNTYYFPFSLVEAVLRVVDFFRCFCSKVIGR